MEPSQIISSTQHAEELFLKLSSFTRYFVDHVLSGEVFKKSLQTDNLENVIAECDALIISLQTFKKLSSVLQSNESFHSNVQANHIPSSSLKKNDSTDILPKLNLPVISHINELPVVIDDRSKIKYDPSEDHFRIYCDKIRNSILSIPDIKKFTPFYCKVCNRDCPNIFAFQAHCTSKNHFGYINQMSEPINNYKCKVCKLAIIIPESEIIKIMNLPEHCNLDKHIQKLLEPTPEQVKNDSVDNVNWVDSDNHIETNKESKFKKSVSLKVQEVFFMWEKKLMDEVTSEIASHYCTPCDIITHSRASFIEHNSSKKHIETVNCTTQPISVIKCENCGFLITGHQSKIDRIINSEIHLDFDGFILRANKKSRTKRRSGNTLDMPRSSAMSISETEQKNLENNTEDNNKLPGFTFPIHLVPEKFLTFNCKLQKDDFTKSGFCRPCKKGVNVNEGWATHVAGRKHINMLDKLQFKDSFSSCNYCPMQMLGDEYFENACMRLHVKLNHPNESTEVSEYNLQNPKERISDIRLQEPLQNLQVPEESQNSGEREKVNLNIEIKVNHQFPHGHGKDTVCEISTNNCSFKEPIPTPRDKADEPLQMLIELLNKMKTVYQNEGLKQFGGMCLLCNLSFKDYYEWILHLKNPGHHNLVDVCERECSFCNLSLFGFKSDIESNWSLEEHILLDALLSE